MTEGTNMNQIETVARPKLIDELALAIDQFLTHRVERDTLACDLTQDELTELATGLAAIAAMPVQAEPVAWMYERKPEEWPPSGPVVQRTRWRMDNPARPFWIEHALYAHPPAQWQGIESAPDLERVIVAGWNPHSGNVRGYWWYGEDVVSNGRAIEHPRATHWRPFNNPAFPTPPAAGGSDAE